jgi:hypothetical protein
MDPRSGVNAVEKGQISTYLGDQNMFAHLVDWLLGKIGLS